MNPIRIHIKDILANLHKKMGARLGKARIRFFLDQLSGNLEAAMAAFREDPDKSFAFHVHRFDCRTPLFKIQALVRLLDKKKKRNLRAAQALLSVTKTVEDMIGQFDFAASLLEGLNQWDLPETLRRDILITYGFAQGSLEECLLQLGWITRGKNGIHGDDFGFDYLHKALDTLSFPSSGKESKYLLGFFRTLCQDLDAEVRQGKSDLTQLEDGIHEFRRDIRWLSIYASALRGKVFLTSPVADDPFQDVITPENKLKKYNVLPHNEKEKDRIGFPEGGFYALGELISALGTIKDKGLVTEYIMLRGRKLGLTDKDLQRGLGMTYQDAPTTIRLAQEKVNAFVLEKEGFLKIGAALVLDTNPSPQSA